MKYTVSNREHLKNIFIEIANLVDINKTVNVSYDEVKQKKTKKQLGYIFGGLLKAVKIWHYSNTGETLALDDVKFLFYRAILPLHEVDFHGQPIKRYLGLSEMTVQDAGEFITKAIDLIDNDPIFEDFILPIELRYCWLNSVTSEEIKIVKSKKFEDHYPEYLCHVRNLNCMYCGIAGISNCHHVRLGSQTGMKQKPSDVYVIPLCPEHHDLLHNKKGEFDFYKELKSVIGDYTIQTFCELCFNRWLNKKGS